MSFYHDSIQTQNRIDAAMRLHSVKPAAELRRLAGHYVHYASRDLGHIERPYYAGLAARLTALAIEKEAQGGGGPAPAPAPAPPAPAPAPAPPAPAAAPAPPAPENWLARLDRGRVVIHPELAAAVMRQKSADLERAYAVWTAWRSLNKTWLSRAEFNELAAKAGKSAQSIRKWLDAGEAIFWRIERGKIWLNGKNAVLNYFGIVAPGKRAMLPASDVLTSRLADLRAALHTAYFSKTRWLSRAQIGQKIGRTGQTQRAYESRGDLTKTPVYSLEKWTDEAGREHEARQLQNRYSSHYESFSPKPKKRHGWRTTGFLSRKTAPAGGVDNATTSPTFGKRLFDNARACDDKRRRLAAQGQGGEVLFAVVEPARRTKKAKNTLFVRPVVV